MTATVESTVVDRVEPAPPEAPAAAAAEAPANPVPTIMISKFLLLAGFTSFTCPL